MPKAPFGDLLQYLRRMYPAEDAGRRTDGELLNRFVTGHEEDAFTVLVQRHGPMVLGVCQRLLGDLHLAEDAFQATLIVLARRAAAIRSRTSLGTWLYAVAQRIAMKAKAKTALRRNGERQLATMPRAERLDEHTWQELRSIIDEEIGRLPEKYQAPLVLCHLEGKSHDRAAKELGCAKTTLERRLSRGRELLRQQLIRRGVTLSAGAVATVLGDKLMGAPVTSFLTIKTVKAATFIATGKSLAGCVSAGVVALAEEAGMFGIKGKLVLFVLAIGVAVGGAGWAGYGGLREKSQSGPEAQAQAPAANDQAAGPVKKDLPIATDRLGDPLPPGAVARLGPRRFRHDGEATALIFTPDGTELVGRTNSGVIIWDAATGKERQRLPGPLHNLLSGDAGGMDVSPDGITLAVSEYNRRELEEEAKISLWDLRTGKKARTFSLPKGQAKEYYRLCFSPDGKSLAWSSANEGKAFVFDVATGRVRASLGSRDSTAFYNLTFAPDSRTIAAAVHSNNSKTFGRNHGVQIWDVGTDKAIRTIHDLPARSMPDFRPIPNLPPRKPEITVGKLAFAPDGKILAFGIKDHIFVADPTTGKELGHFEATMGQCVGLAFAGDGKKLVSGHEDGSVRVWDVATGDTLHTLNSEHTGRSLALSPDGATIALGTDRHAVQLWDAANWEGTVPRAPRS